MTPELVGDLAGCAPRIALVGAEKDVSLDPRDGESFGNVLEAFFPLHRVNLRWVKLDDLQSLLRSESSNHRRAGHRVQIALREFVW